jgi:hypothetical protein
MNAPIQDLLLADQFSDDAFEGYLSAEPPEGVQL